ncbi:hypothetical protein HYH02_013439 [Chlamydomonas schloesseri]|uniref:C2 domain-containing protein n=1 Tax=Chlamydomonas schloesseri TaxID=2026947 RepID=A0A835VZ71_9CHLO|nr:hypothetical protein HYH02_013439 [Chlamydomonas schloesseri]|eukprot:KAG2431308.1 hypothetical protein HYH02_013439 [Chlamydomonas schloesseri]
MVLPFIGAGIATGIGTLAGLSLGPYIFSALTKPTSYYLLREEVDNDHKVASPEPGLLVRTQYRNTLPLLEPWVTDPDYERTSMINRLTATVWPTMTKAIMDMIVQGDVYNTVLYPQLQAQVFGKFAFVEDIFLGPHSLKHGKIDLKTNPFLADKLFTVGAVAPRIGGMRVVPTADDEVLLETSMIWGSQAQFDVHVVLRFGRLRLIVPLQLGNISFKADVRVLLRPLVEQFPCLGGVSISLLRVPTVDFSLKLVKGVDIMALPFIPQIVAAAMRVVLEPVTLPLLNKPLVPGIGLVLPNAMSFPIMPKFGLPDPPVGALKVMIMHLTDIRGGDDLYVRAEVRKGRTQQTRTVDNNRSPVFEEEFNLIVDSFENDVLKLQVWRDDMGWQDTLLSEVEVPFRHVVTNNNGDPEFDDEGRTKFTLAEFVKDQKSLVMKLPLKRFRKKDRFGKSMTRSASRSAASVTGAAGAGAPGGVPPPPEKTSSRLKRLFTLKKKPKEQPPAAPSATSNISDSEMHEGPAAVPSAYPGAARPSGSMARAPSMGRTGSAIGGDVVADARDECGSITIRVLFIPFNKPEYDDIQAEREVKSKVADPYRSMFPAPPGRTLALMGDGGGGGKSQLSLGVLTVQLVRCIDLAPEGAKDLATYVRMLVTNDTKDEEQTSSVILNETSPRWGDKFDFVLIPSNSELHIQVFNKQGMLGNLVGSLFSRKKEDKDPILGKVLIRVEDVARNGRIKETWSLQDAERGYIELNLIWQTCHVSRDQLNA